MNTHNHILSATVRRGRVSLESVKLDGSRVRVRIGADVVDPNNRSGYAKNCRYEAERAFGDVDGAAAAMKLTLSLVPEGETIRWRPSLGKASPLDRLLFKSSTSLTS